MTDGVVSWTRHEFDHTKVPTKDDWGKFKEDLSEPHQHPLGRIEIMHARLDSLKNITPTIQLHVDAIRKIHADFLATKPVTLESLDALEKQNDHWLKIKLISEVLPLARKKVKANKDVRIAAQKERKKDPMRAAIIEVMVPSKRNHESFHTFMQSWGLNQINGLSVKRIDSEKYFISDENGDIETATYKRSTLQKMYSE
jgi:hypothetical protein